VPQDLEGLVGADPAGDHEDAQGLVDDGTGDQCVAQLVVQDGVARVAQENRQCGGGLRGEGLGPPDVVVGEGVGVVANRLSAPWVWPSMVSGREKALWMPFARAWPA
jgi:hypothetical protein